MPGADNPLTEPEQAVTKRQAPGRHRSMAPGGADQAPAAGLVQQLALAVQSQSLDGGGDPVVGET